MSEYNTIVFANGQIMQWYPRKQSHNRFKCVLTERQRNLIEEAIADSYIEYLEDCDEYQFAAICRAIAIL